MGAVTALELAQQQQPQEQDEQLTADMFEGETALPLPSAAREAEKRGPGRPKGARNRSTEQMRKYLLSKYGSPLIVFAETYSRPTEQLARELKMFRYVDGWPVYELCDDGKWREQLAPDALQVAFNLQIEAAKAIAPYTDKKQPMAIETPDGAQLGLLVIGNMATQQGGAEQPYSLPLVSEQNQSLIEGDSVRLPDEKSDE